MGWERKRILVTGGAGFLGSHVVEQLRIRGCEQIVVPRSRQYDLRDPQAGRRLFIEARPHLVLHLAGTVGGIGANKRSPGRFFYDNALMGIELLELAREFGVEKFVNVGTICSYPLGAAIPFREDSLWDGYPEPTNGPYALAKKMLLVQGQAYRSQYGLNAIYLLPANLYGPRENFDLETSHVIPAIIRKCVEANETGASHVVLWGDGSPTRDFLYVEDAARGIVQAAFAYDDAKPVNLGSGVEIAIREVASLITSEVGFRGRVIWDTARPAGQPRRLVDTTRARECFGFEARTSLQEGIRRTIRWYLQSRAISRPVCAKDMNSLVTAKQPRSATDQTGESS